MLGAIAGDIIGSVFEHENVKTADFPLFRPSSRFTDDSVLTVAVADCLINQEDYAKKFEDYYYHYPNAGFGSGFQDWARSHEHKPYNSWGNGAAMRVSPIGYAFRDLEQVLDEAKRCAEVTHNHPEGIKGAQAVAGSIFLARNGGAKMDIKRFVQNSFGYDLNQTVAEIRPVYSFDVSCQGTVPQAIIAFLESSDFESAIRIAISLGGDSDTLGCIAGGIAEAFYKEIPIIIVRHVFQILDERLAHSTRTFIAKFNPTILPVVIQESKN